MFRFTIREAVLLTVIAAIGLAWRLDHLQGLIALDKEKAARDSDSELYTKRWDKREREWIEANRWWHDAKEAWMRDKFLKRS